MDEPKSYNKALVAFIDILGFKDIIIKSEKDQDLLAVLQEALNFIKSWEAPERWNLKPIEFEEDAQRKGLQLYNIKNRTNSTTFSDSIVVSVSLTKDDDLEASLSAFVANLSMLGAYLIKRKILIRGGITIGNIIHESSGTVFGKALIDAYLLESKTALYPRIILSDKLIEKLTYPIKQKNDRDVYHQYLQRFDDGCFGFHQLIVSIPATPYCEALNVF